LNEGNTRLHLRRYTQHATRRQQPPTLRAVPLVGVDAAWRECSRIDREMMIIIIIICVLLFYCVFVGH
jgi:hypothetical protein